MLKDNVSTLPEMPNAPVLEMYGQKKRLTLPIRLKPLLESMIEEVLLAEPENIYEFLADFLETKYQEEEKAKRLALTEDVQKIASTDVFNVYSAQVKIDSEAKIEDKQLQDILSQKAVDIKEAHDLAILIQKIWRGYMTRKKLKKVQAPIDDEVLHNIPKAVVEDILESVAAINEAKKTILLDPNKKYRMDTVKTILAAHNLNLDKANQIVAVIQKNWRDYVARKRFENSKGGARRLSVDSKEVPANVIEGILSALTGFGNVESQSLAETEQTEKE